jgi:hypothetical protein
MRENELFKYFMEYVIKNIERREDERKKNKMLLEKVIQVSKKLLKIKNSDGASPEKKLI